MVKCEKSIKTTNAVCQGALLGCLGMEGYEVHFENSYIEAYGEKKNLLIFPVNRCLANRNKVEDTLVSASKVGLCKFLEQYHMNKNLLERENVCEEDLYTVINDAGRLLIPCIAFNVCKYHYGDIEIMIVPISVIKRKAERGGVFSISAQSGNYNYNFNKIGECEIIDDIIFRKKIKIVD
jgi:hypothetical protein